MKSLTAVLLTLLLSLSTFSWASNLTQQQSNLYTFQSTIAIQEDFLTGGTSSTNIGNLGWTSSGTITVPASETNRLGIVKLDTTAVSATVARIHFNQAVAIDPALPTILKWTLRLNTNDANTTLRFGAQNSAAGNPPAEGIYIEKLDADTNWFCITRAGAVQTRTDSTVAVTTNFTAFSYTRNSSGVQFSINNVNVCSLMTTNIPTVFISPEVFIINSAAASKTVDLDYFQLFISGIVRQ